MPAPDQRADKRGRTVFSDLIFRAIAAASCVLDLTQRIHAVSRFQLLDRLMYHFQSSSSPSSSAAPSVFCTRCTMVLAVNAHPNTLPFSSRIRDLVIRPEVRSENTLASLADFTRRLAQAVPGERTASMRLAHYMLPNPTCTKR